MEYESPYPSVTTACDNYQLRFLSTTRAYLLRIPTRLDTWMKVVMLIIPNGWSWKTLGLNRCPGRTRHHGPSSLDQINAGPPPAHPRPRLHTAGAAPRRGGRARHGVHPRRELRMSFSLYLESETVTYRFFCIEHGFGPFLAFRAGTTNYLCASLLVFARLATFICHTRSIEHLVESKLFHKLSPCIRGCLELLHKIFPIAFVMKHLVGTVAMSSSSRTLTGPCTHLHVMLTHELVKMLACLINVLLACGVKFKFQFCRRRKIGPSRARPRRTKIDLVVR